MSVNDFLSPRADTILAHAVASLGARRLPSYEQIGAEASAERLRAFFLRVVECARTRDLVPLLEHAERVGRERYASGFEFVEVQSAMNLVEEAVWRELLTGYARAELAEALGVVSTIFGAAKDKLATTYLSLTTGKHVPSLDLAALFRGTQNTGGGAAS